MRTGLLLHCFAAVCLAFQGNLPDGRDASDNSGEGKPPAGSTLPAPAPADVIPVQPVEPARVEWSAAIRTSLRLAGTMHAFRWATEHGTRTAGAGLGRGYLGSLANLHGWADGDPFYVNYVGHPMEGSVASRVFLLHDPRYNRAEFGKDREYWKGRLRAAAYAWAFSEQFEIGPFSEASIGHVQRTFPQQGFVDHVVTPSVGLAWTIAEDAMDRHVVRWIERRTRNPLARLAARSALNPARSFANVVDGKVPWYRETRAGVRDYVAARAEPRLPRAIPALQSEPAPAPLEFTVASGARDFAGTPCAGGGAEVGWRATPALQLALDVNGCKMLGLGKNVSGDALVFQAGPRWTPWSASRWSPYAHVLVGGIKLTQEQNYPDRKMALLDAENALPTSERYTLHDQYTSREEATGFAVTAGTGVDYRLNSGLAIRVARLEYLHSTVDRLGGRAYGNGLQVSAGMVLRLGTW